MKEKKIVCSVCGADLTGETVNHFDGEILCIDCLYSKTEVCECCHERIWADNAMHEGGLITRPITMGKPESKICATCEFWEGSCCIRHRGILNQPKEFWLDNRITVRANCLKQHRQCLPGYKCTQHQFRYDLIRYL